MKYQAIRNCGFMDIPAIRELVEAVEKSGRDDEPLLLSTIIKLIRDQLRLYETALESIAAYSEDERTITDALCALGTGFLYTGTLKARAKTCARERGEVIEDDIKRFVARYRKGGK